MKITRGSKPDLHNIQSLLELLVPCTLLSPAHCSKTLMEILSSTDLGQNVTTALHFRLPPPLPSKQQLSLEHSTSRSPAPACLTVISPRWFFNLFTCKKATWLSTTLPKTVLKTYLLLLSPTPLILIKKKIRKVWHMFFPNKSTLAVFLSAYCPLGVYKLINNFQEHFTMYQS